MTIGLGTMYSANSITSRSYVAKKNTDHNTRLVQYKKEKLGLRTVPRRTGSINHNDNYKINVAVVCNANRNKNHPVKPFGILNGVSLDSSNATTDSEFILTPLRIPNRFWNGFNWAAAGIKIKQQYGVQQKQIYDHLQKPNLTNSITEDAAIVAANSSSISTCSNKTADNVNRAAAIALYKANIALISNSCTHRSILTSAYITTWFKIAPTTGNVAKSGNISGRVISENTVSFKQVPSTQTVSMTISITPC
ncbi:uncharacterized protein LOC131687826 [Topomyia yanbarensis]|uniref:uncharacterized protein LOC131687826 n=1 Tax=Topomyia yanbarensis TaxID=2498891 RepID=UPI00273CC249|nr:uncharacterized protein LOC131687826 [Topomyia yanbarensis]